MTQVFRIKQYVFGNMEGCRHDFENFASFLRRTNKCVGIEWDCPDTESRARLYAFSEEERETALVSVKRLFQANNQFFVYHLLHEGERTTYDVHLFESLWDVTKSLTDLRERRKRLPDVVVWSFGSTLQMFTQDDLSRVSHWCKEIGVSDVRQLHICCS